MAEMPDRNKVNREIHRIFSQYRNGTGAIPPLAVDDLRRDLIALVDATLEEALNYGSELGQAVGAREGVAGVQGGTAEVGYRDGAAMLDKAARERLGITGAMFLSRWDAGCYNDVEDPAVTEVAMLIPFVRQ